jgi:hypothetical protein
MSRERGVQLGAFVIVVAALAGCIALMPTIKDQRADLRPNVDAAGLPPEYALVNTALGPFRGLFVDWLWYRTEMLKRQNKIYEVNTNARWITTLQPRFPMVWSYHAWNMAYNVSVKTDTQEERWNWVQKGIRLLREEGIPANPKTLRLYRELGNTFLHKVGMRSDDAHFYYKQRLAERWQTLLGKTTLAEDRQQALDRFGPIVTMAERYVMQDQPPAAMRARLDELAEEYPAYAEQLHDLKQTNLARAQRRVADWRAAWVSVEPKLAEALAPMQDQLATLTSGRPIARFKQGHPKAAPILESLLAAGLTLDEKGLMQLGGLLLKRYYAGADRLNQQSKQLLTDVERAFWPVVQKHDGTEAWQQVLAFVRARVLWDHFNMDPQFMHELIDRFGPLDWRHPASHAVYWSARGVKIARSIRIGGSGDPLNTDRQVIHGLQMLFKNGRVHYSPINFKPLEGYVRYLPDPRFVEAYETALTQARQNLVQRRGEGARLSSFDAGHENLLNDAVVTIYLYGERDQAMRYYRKLRDQYGQRADGTVKHIYQQSLPQFVSKNMQPNLGKDQATTRGFVAAMIRRGLLDGLANGRMQVFDRFVGFAHTVHQRYQSQKTVTDRAPIAEQGRLALPGFREMFIDSYVRVMTGDQRVSLFDRARIYQNTPPALQRLVYPQFEQAVRAEAQRRGAPMETLFPPPRQVQQPSDDTLDAAGAAAPPGS